MTSLLKCAVDVVNRICEHPLGIIENMTGFWLETSLSELLRLIRKEQFCKVFNSTNSMENFCSTCNKSEKPKKFVARHFNCGKTKSITTRIGSRYRGESFNER